jgi:hypothetical protein
MIYLSIAFIVLGGFAYSAFLKQLELKKPDRLQLTSEVHDQIKLLTDRMTNLELANGMTRTR